MKHYKELAAIAAMAFLCAGCGRQGVKVDEPSTTSAPVMWKTEGFAVNDEVVEEQELWVDRHIKWEHDAVQWDEETEEIYASQELGVRGNSVFRCNFIAGGSDYEHVRSVVECIDISSMETSVTVFMSEQTGKISGEPGFVTSVGMYGDDNYVFQWIGNKLGDTDNFYFMTNDKLVYIDANGETKETNLIPACLEKGLSTEEYVHCWKFGKCVCDSYGNSYVISSDGDALNVFDIEGNLLMEYKCPENVLLQLPMKTEDGELIYPCHDDRMNKTYILWFDVENRKVETLATIKGSIVQLYGMQENDLYYENKQGIVRWNIASGERKLIFIFNENGIQDIYHKQLILRDNDIPVLRMYGYVNGQFQDWLVSMSDKQVVKAGTVRVAGTASACDRVRNCAGVAARYNPDYAYEYENGNGMDESDFHTMIMTQMASGDGPDILYVSPDDMEMLHEKGLLADLSEYISEDTLRTVMPSVVELGTRDGTLIGMPAGVAANSLMVQDDVWGGDSWTIEDIISLIESGRLSGRMSQNDELCSSDTALRTLLKYMVDDSFIIDWESYESHFEDERFIKLLKYLGRYSAEKTNGKKELLDGSIKQEGVEYLFQVDNYLGARGNEGWHYVGFPTKKGCGSYIWTDGMVVVNARTAAKDAVSAYLECLLSKEVQDTANTVGFLTRMPVLPLSVDDIIYEDYGSRYTVWHNGVIKKFADGCTSVHETKELLERSVPAPRRYNVIQNIMWEELPAYYSGDKTAEEVAALIDDRVQLYLDEIR